MRGWRRRVESCWCGGSPKKAADSRCGRCGVDVGTQSYRWLARHRSGGAAALADRSSAAWAPTICSAVPSAYRSRARLIAVVWVLAVAGLVPAILVHDLVGVADFTLYLFFTGLAGAPVWAAAIDIAPKRLLRPGSAS